MDDASPRLFPDRAGWPGLPTRHCGEVVYGREITQGHASNRSLVSRPRLARCMTRGDDEAGTPRRMSRANRSAHQVVSPGNRRNGLGLRPIPFGLERISNTSTSESSRPPIELPLAELRGCVLLTTPQGVTQASEITDEFRSLSMQRDSWTVSRRSEASRCRTFESRADTAAETVQD